MATWSPSMINTVRTTPTTVTTTSAFDENLLELIDTRKPRLLQDKIVEGTYEGIQYLNGYEKMIFLIDTTQFF